MPRLSLIRSFWIAICLGVVSIALSLGGQQVAWGQVSGGGGYDPMDAMNAGIDASSSAMGGQAQPGKALVNISSGLKRSGSSLSGAQAFFYDDTAFVLRVNFAKIDYEGLSEFVDELVDKGVGSIRSDDKYRVELRDYQRDSIKSNFQQMASIIQNTIVKECFGNGIDELYVFAYITDAGTELYGAVSLEGLTDAQQNKVVDRLASLNSIAVFKRFGFAVSVVLHPDMVQPDLEPIQEKYLAKIIESKRSNVYGSYGNSQNASNRSGMGDSYDARGASGVTGARGAESAAAAAAAKLPPELAGLPANLVADCVKDIEDAKEKARAESRKNVLPFVRRRFTSPASAASAKVVGETLALSDGACLSFVSPQPEAFLSSLPLFFNRGGSGAPFAGLGGAQDSDGVNIGNLQQGVNDQEFLSSLFKEAEAVSLSVSLVGAPKVAVLASLKEEETATNVATAAKAAIQLGKGQIVEALQAKFDDAIAEADPDAESVDLSPLFDAVLTGLEPVQDGKFLAVALSFEPLRENASLLLPLFQGVESKSAQEIESEEIDWSRGDDSAASDPAADDEEEDDDDPYSITEAEDEEDNSVQTDEDDEDDPFGDDEF